MAYLYVQKSMNMKEVTMTVQVNTDNFEDEVLKSKVPVLVDFYAKWCGPCKMMGPVVDKVSDAILPQGKVCKLDIDESIDIAMRYKVVSVPTFILFYNGQAVETRVGTSSQDELMQMF